MNDFSRYWDALTFVFSRHDEQKRKSANIPYVIHPIRVALILRSVGYSEFKHENLMIAALCHDLIEDTETTFEELSEQFGKQVALFVDELTRPDNTNKDEWINTFETKSMEAKVIKMADRIDNLKDMPSSKWTRETQIKYAQQGDQILKHCRHANLKIAGILKRTIQEVLQNEN
jgi:guanosine-3',5'-bis(diphosphate) 3'-pyrophosphohydrolase